LEQDLSTVSRSEQCQECGSTRQTRSNGGKVIFCPDCGAVFDAKEAAGISRLRKNRTRHVSSDHAGKGGGESSDPAGETALDKNALLDSRRLLEHLQERITWSDQTEKNLSLALLEISKSAVELSLPPAVLQRAALLYRQIVEKRLTTGRSVQVLCAVVIYVTCRQSGSVRDLREIAKVARVEKQEVIRHYRIISRKLDCFVPVAMLTQYAPRILVNIGVQGRSAEFTNKILNVIQGSKIACGREPASLVSAAAYLGSKLAGEKVTQRQISIAAGLTEVTIRNTCKELQRELDFVMSV